MLSFLTKNPFQNYALLIVALSSYAVYAFKEYKQQKELYPTLEKIFEGNKKLEFKSLDRRFYEFQDACNDNPHKKNISLLKKSKALNKRISALYNSCQNWSLEDEDKLVKYIEERGRQRDSLYQFLGSLHQDSLKIVAEDILLINENSIKDKTSARIEQRYLIENAKLLHDLSAANKVLDVLFENIYPAAEYDKAAFYPVFSIEKPIVKVNEAFKGEVFPFHHFIRDERLTLLVNGDTIPTKNGVGIWEKTYWTPGEKSYKVEWQIQNPATGNVYPYKQTFKTYIIK